MITEKLIYTCRWLESHMDVDGCNSDGLLPHQQLCWSHFRWRVRLQDWLHSGDEFSTAFKVNYISEDLLLVMATSHLVYQPKSLIQSCFVCHWHQHWHHRASLSMSVHTSPSHRVRHRNFLFGVPMHICPPYMHIK